MNPLYNKFYVALGTIVAAVVAAMAPTASESAFVITINEWYMIVVVAAGAIFVRQVSNKGV